MKLKIYIKNLEKRKIVSKQPHPIIPFVLAAIIYILAAQIYDINKTFSKAFYILAVFTFVFAIIHLIVYKTLTSKQK